MRWALGRIFCNPYRADPTVTQNNVDTRHIIGSKQDQKTYIDAGRNTDFKKCDITHYLKRPRYALASKNDPVYNRLNIWLIAYCYALCVIC